ncbi:serine/threonine-protein kinase [Streptomyces lavendulae]|uniref:serine/threonine-protein kinase n=1 Tax=Streptomyces lavendulae TaxID=1914 RepID=UPI0036A38E0A
MAGEGYEGRIIAGRYRLVSELGSGGFGQVWKAWDENLRVDVALKVVSLGQAGTPAERAERLMRAERESRHAAQLRTHPNVVAVHDVVVEEGIPWMVMELVSGRSLEQVIGDEGLIPVERAEGIAEAVLEALRAAHAIGIVHRDVKPANILLAGDGRVLLADFGIAVRDSDTKLTGTGMVIGSMEYIAPERAEGEDGGPASDLFSLGVTLYQAVEGFSPFKRASVSASLRAVLAHDPAPLPHPGPLAPLIMRLLAKDPANRPTAETALGMLRTRAPIPPAVTEPHFTADLPQPPQTQTLRTRPPQAKRVGVAVLGVLFIGLSITLAVGFGFFPNAADLAAPHPTVGFLTIGILSVFIWGCSWVGFLVLSESVISERTAHGLAKYGGGALVLLAVAGASQWADITVF